MDDSRHNVPLDGASEDNWAIASVHHYHFAALTQLQRNLRAFGVVLPCRGCAATTLAFPHVLTRGMFPLLQFGEESSHSFWNTLIELPPHLVAPANLSIDVRSHGLTRKGEQDLHRSLGNKSCRS